MSKSAQETIKDHPTWEVLGVVLGFFGTANQFPDLVNTVLDRYPDPKLMPWSFKMLSIGGLLVFLIVLGVLVYWLRTRPRTAPSREGRAVRAFKRAMLVGYIKQLPMSLIADLICRFYGVWGYDWIDTGRNQWPPRDGFFSYVGRFRMDGCTMQFEFPRTFDFIKVNRTLPGSSNFGDPEIKNWYEVEKPLLVLTSWFGIYWALRYFIKSGCLPMFVGGSERRDD